MSILLEGVKYPDICQNCPCYQLFSITKDKYVPIGVIQVCTAKDMKALKKYRHIDNIDNDWYHTEKPEWCPAKEVS